MKHILVYYIDVRNISEEKMPEFMEKISKRISTSQQADNYEIIFIPVNRTTSIECINPKYITDSDLIKKHERLMAEFHENLEHQIKQLKKIK